MAGLTTLLVTEVKLVTGVGTTDGITIDLFLPLNKVIIDGVDDDTDTLLLVL